jgi:hypothetical protein
MIFRARILNLFGGNLVGFFTSILVGLFRPREFGLNTVGLNSNRFWASFLKFM